MSEEKKNEEEEFKPPDFFIEPPPQPPPASASEENKKEEESKIEDEKKETTVTSEKTAVSNIPARFLETWASDGVKGIFMTNLIFGLVFFVMGRMQMGFVLLLITVSTITYVSYNFVVLRKRQLRQDQVSRLVFMTNNGGLDNDVLQMMMSELPAWVRFPEIESVRWLNKSITKLWIALRPCLDTYVSNLYRSLLTCASLSELLEY
mgnify:CR=1 FL=1